MKNAQRICQFTFMVSNRHLAKHLSNLLETDTLPFVTVYKLLSNNKELMHYEVSNQSVSFQVRFIMFFFVMQYDWVMAFGIEEEIIVL